MERSPKLSPSRQLALRFIAGKYKGSELLLEEGRELTVGRVGDVDMVLAEDMVSRLHARIWLEANRIIIEDLGSTNGTFVNGEKIRREILKEGDRILIGTNILKVVSLDPGTGGARAQGGEPPQGMNIFEETRALNTDEETTTAGPTANARPDEAPSSVRSRTSGGRSSMSGAIDDFPLPYLLQLLESSQKSGVLVVRADTGEVAKIYLKKGATVFATTSAGEEIAPLKVVFRVLEWTRGTFDLEAAEDRAFPTQINDSMQVILMEGLRQLDELNAIRPRLPDKNARLILMRPLKALLRDLGPSDLDALQLAINYGVLSSILNKSAASDLDTSRAMLRLIEGGYLRVG